MKPANAYRLRAKRLITLIAGFTAAILSFSATAETIKIGVAGPYSGDLASYGVPARQAAELVISKVNASGGINGNKVELVAEDDVCKPEIAVNVATKMVSEGVKVVLGHICSGATKAALSIYNDAGVLVISPSATNPPLTQSGDYPNFFRTIAPDDAQAETAVNFAIKQGLKKVAILHDKGDYGKGFAEFSRAFAEKTGRLSIVLFEGITPGAVDYSAAVQTVRKSGADSVIYGGYHPEASKIVTLMRKKKVSIPFISDDGVKDDTFIKVAKKYAEGVYATGPNDTSDTPLSKTAHKEFAAKYDAEPGAFFKEGYAAALALVNALKKTRSDDIKDLKKILRTDYVETPLGSIRFDERGDAVGVGFSVFQVQNGQYVEVK